MTRSKILKASVCFTFACSAHASLLIITPQAEPETALVAGSSMSVNWNSSFNIPHSVEATPSTKADDTEEPTQKSPPPPRKQIKDTKTSIKPPAAKSKPPEPVELKPEIPQDKIAIPKLPATPLPKTKAAVEESVEPPPTSKQTSQTDTTKTNDPENAKDAGKTSSSAATHKKHPNDETKLAASKAQNFSSAATQSAHRKHNNTAVGNAAESNYKGLVLQHLARRKKPRATSPGSAFVAFTITQDGQIEAISISKSSGSNRFDREALKLIRRASPFPLPPNKAKTSFTVEIKGK